MQLGLRRLISVWNGVLPLVASEFAVLFMWEGGEYGSSESIRAARMDYMRVDAVNCTTRLHLLDS